MKKVEVVVVSVAVNTGSGNETVDVGQSTAAVFARCFQSGCYCRNPQVYKRTLRESTLLIDLDTS